MNSQISNLKSQIQNPIAQSGGVALMAVVLTLTILAVMISAIAWQMLANRRMLEHREYELQAAWLARAGVEHAAARVLTNPDGYSGETIEPVELSTVRIEVTPDPDSPGAYRITSEARFPTDAKDFVTRTMTRRFKRLTDGGTIRLESLPTND